jgi:GntR family transcriptional regulator/MocR family aminotransferase
MPELILQQQDRNGVPALRKAIAAHVTLLRGLDCSPSQIFLATCIPAAVELAIHALGLIGSEFWVEDPCCRSPRSALFRSGIRMVPVPVDEEGIDVEQGILSAPRAAAAFVTPSCQAPTGVLLGAGRRRRLAEWAERVGAWIFEDDFNWNGDGTSPPIAPYAAFHSRRTVYFNSFNNILFPGLRVAYLVSPPELVDAFASVRGNEGDVNTANQLILADFIEEGHLDIHMRRLNACNAERRAALLNAAERQLPEFLVPKHSRGGFFICGLNSSSEADLVAASEARNISIAGMSWFNLTPSGRNEVVLGFSQFEPRCLAKAAIALRDVLNAMHRATSAT